MTSVPLSVMSMRTIVSLYLDGHKALPRQDELCASIARHVDDRGEAARKTFYREIEKQAEERC